MRVVTIGIVAEGGSDSVVIQNLLLAYVKSHVNISCELRFLNVQPYTDQTSKPKFSEAGWMQVFKWCISNPPIERRMTFLGNGLFADDMDGLRCTALLIHMDADICDKIDDKTDVTPVPNKNEKPDARGKFITAVINGWLWPGGEIPDNNHVISPAVESTEAWLVAGISDDDKMPEANHDIQKRLAELDHTIIRKKPVPLDIQKPKKTIKNYTTITSLASKNIDRILLRCPHFKSMADHVVRIVEEN